MASGWCGRPLGQPEWASGRDQLTGGDSLLPGARARTGWWNEQRDEPAALGHLDGLSGLDSGEIAAGVLTQLADPDAFHA